METTLQRITRRIIVWAPIMAMPVIINVRWMEMAWPTTQPKWGAFILLGLILAVASSIHSNLHCRQPLTESARAPRPAGTRPAVLASLVFLIGLAAGAVYALNPGEALNRLALWYAAALTLWSVCQASRMEPHFTFRLQFGLCAAALILCLHFWYGYFFDFGRPEFDKFVLFSLIGHFNYTADVLVSLIPLLAWITLSPQIHRLRWVAGFCLSTAAMMMLSSGSLGGMGGLAIGGVFTLALMAARHYRAAKQHRLLRPLNPRALLLTTGLIFTAAFAVKPVIEHLPKEYRNQLFTRAIWWSAPQVVDLSKEQRLPPLAPVWVAIMPLLGARTPMWAATAGMLADRPWLGFGTGSFVNEYPAFQKQYPLFMDPETLGATIKSNPHNAFLYVAAENGIPMAILFTVLFLWLAGRVIKQAWQDPSAFWLCAVWALWSLGLDMQFNQVFYNPASLFMTSILCGHLVGRLPCLDTSWPMTSCWFWRWPATPYLATTLALALSTVSFRWLVSEYHMAQASKPLEHYSLLSTARRLKSLKTAYAAAPWNGQAIYGLAMFYYNTGNLPQAEAYLTEFLRLSPHHSVALNLLASIQITQDRLDEAEANLKQALRLEPDAKAIKENLDLLQHQRQQQQNYAVPQPLK